MSLFSYIEENPNDMLVIGKTITGKYYIRPSSWCGEYVKAGDNILLTSGNCLNYFKTLEQAENSLKKLNFKNYKIIYTEQNLKDYRGF